MKFTCYQSDEWVTILLDLNLARAHKRGYIHYVLALLTPFCGAAKNNFYYFSKEFFFLFVEFKKNNSIFSFFRIEKYFT